MDVKFPLLSILSVGFLLFFALQGGDVTLHSLELGVVTTPDGVRITIDPAFLVYADQMYPVCAGETFGNVAVIHSPLRGTRYEEWVKRFELNHIIQYRALGWWSYPAMLILPIDPHAYQPQHWDDPTEADGIMWLPPDWWRDQWHWLTINVRFQ